MMSTILNALFVTLALAYAIWPWLMFVLTLRLQGRSNAKRDHAFSDAITLSLALFCIVAPWVMHFYFRAYSILHSFLIIIGTLLFVAALRNHERSRTPWKLDVPFLSVLVLAWLVRLIPIAVGAPVIGGDGRFHHILIQKILATGALAQDWSPYAPVDVVYPQGTHALTAFLCRLTRLPPHDCFAALLPLIGVLTVGVIHRTATRVFDSRRAGLTAAMVYAFLPVWGSVGYVAWGGLPNAMGMLFLVTVFGYIANTSLSGNQRIAPVTFLLAAIVACHHYTALVAALSLGVFWLVAGKQAGRGALAQAGIAAGILALPALWFSYFRHTNELGETNALSFGEAPITIFEVIGQINPLLIGLVIVALVRHRELPWKWTANMMLLWAAVLLAAFVVLEYGYRFAVFAISNGEAFHSALTPSRMATDMVYPLSILAGGSVLAVSLRRYHMIVLGLIGAFAIVSCWSVTTPERGIGVERERAVGFWIGHKTPRNAAVISDLPLSENWSYFCGRETNLPILPASEARQHPDVVAARERDTVVRWLIHCREVKRPLFYVTEESSWYQVEGTPVFSRDGITVLRLN